MDWLTKASLSLLVLLVVIAAAPGAKADPIVLSRAGFTMQNPGHTRTGAIGMDSLIGAAASSSHTMNGTGSFITLLNPLTITSGFTGINSSGTCPFNFSQLTNVSRPAQTMNLSNRLDIDHLFDSLHLQMELGSGLRFCDLLSNQTPIPLACQQPHNSTQIPLTGSVRS